MRWTDRVYGDVILDDPDILNLIATSTFARLRGIRQAGPSTLAFPFKTVTRHEHSLGVYLLLRRLGADRREQVAGLLHDISHTAFSHAVDFVVSSQEQDHHEGLKPVFLNRPDIVSALKRLGHLPEAFFNDSIYPLLERPLPWLCADRLDYFFRDGLTCQVVTHDEVQGWLNNLVVHDHTIAFGNVESARDAAAKFATMNRDWWASPSESFIYNEFADALREGFQQGSLREIDLLGDDAHVLSCLKSARSERIEQSLRKIYKFQPEMLESFTPKVTPKERWLDPPILIDGELRRLSEL